jgi:hypothetical protein
MNEELSDKAFWKGLREKNWHQKESGIGFLFFISFLIVVAIDGEMLTQFGNLTYNYWIQAWLTGFVWLCIVVSIPVGIYYLLRYIKNQK